MLLAPRTALALKSCCGQGDIWRNGAKNRGFFSLQSRLVDHFAVFRGVCARRRGGGIDEADLAGRATASSFTMVTRRNLYAMGMGRWESL